MVAEDQRTAFLRQGPGAFDHQPDPQEGQHRPGPELGRRHRVALPSTPWEHRKGQDAERTDDEAAEDRPPQHPQPKQKSNQRVHPRPLAQHRAPC